MYQIFDHKGDIPQKLILTIFLRFSGDNLCCDHHGFFGQANILSKVSSYLQVIMYQKFCPELSLK